MFETLSPTPPDALIGLIKLAQADTRTDKIDLGVGIYQDSNGVTPVMKAVKAAERQWVEQEETKKYIGIHGNPQYNELFSQMLFGKNAPILSSGRLAVAQSAGGSGALRLGAELIKLARPSATVWVSTPTWANHIPLISAAGLTIKPYAYYDKQTQKIDFEAMCAALENDTVAGDVVLLHGCCHNPTGADLTQIQWQKISDILLDKKLIPFVDLAYSGLGDGLDEDSYALRLMADKHEEVILAASCSKNFGLYRERTGLVGIIAKTPEQADIVHSQFGLTIRRMISMPPDHGAALVAKILSTPDLYTLWREELEEMRLRMMRLRGSLADALSVQGHGQMADAIKGQNGMFSLLPISPEQADTLRTKHSIYLPNSGRINIAGARTQSIARLADCILDVL